MFSSIPMPQQSNMFEGIVEQYLKQKQYEIQNKQRQDQLALQQQADSRNQQLFPYKLQNMQQDARQRDAVNRMLFPNSQQDESTNAPQLPDKNRSMIESFVNSGQANPEDVQQIQGFLQSQGSLQQQPQPRPPMPNAPQMGRKDLVNIANQDTEFFARQGQTGNNVPNQAQNIPMQNNQPVIITPPQKGKEGWDNFAGQKVSGIQIPKVQVIPGDGYKDFKYPSGKVERVKTGPSYEERIKLQTKAREEAAAAKISETAKQKRIDDLRVSAKSFDKLLNHAANVDEILEKTPNITGFGTPTKVKYGFGSGEQGKLQANIMPLIGPLAKEMSERGGAVVAGFAQSGKPGLGNSPEYNREMTKSILKEGYRTYNNLKKEFEDLGQEFPYKLPKRLDRFVIKAPDGKKYVKSEEEAKKFKIEHPELEILGNYYELQ